MLSNGFYVLLLAGRVCAKVTVYGFLREWRGATHYHYYKADDGPPQETFNKVRPPLIG